MAKHDHVEKGPGLARGPALIMGAILMAAGLLALVKHSTFPSFGSNFPDGTATGSKWLGLFGVNGWTCWLVIACGALLLFGSAQHLAAKTMSLIVGLILGAASVIALVDKRDVFGLAYQNGLTKLALGIAAAILLFNVLMPRVKHKTDDHDHDHDHDRTRRAGARRVQAEPVRRTETRRVKTDPARRVETERLSAEPTGETTRGTVDRYDDPTWKGGSVNAADDRPRRR